MRETDLSLRSRSHRRAKVVHVPDVDFRLVPTGCKQVVLQHRQQNGLMSLRISLAARTRHLRRGGSTGSHLEGVDVERPHRPRVLLALGDDHVGLPRHDLGGVVQDHVAVLPPGDQDPGRVAVRVHPIGTPHQFVVSVRGGEAAA